MERLIIEDYLSGFLSNSELSLKYDLHRGTIQRILKKNNIVLRKKTPKIKVDHHFFSSYNEKSCYWAGFILADGYLRTNKRNTLTIKLKKSDYGHLEKFKKEIQYEGVLKIKDNYVLISISSSKIINDLETFFEIKTKKSLTCYISEKIPPNQLRHFIRGYFDGDGTITKTTTDTVNFIGTRNTVDFIRSYFFDECKIKLRTKNIPEIIKKDNIFVICYYGKTAFKILKTMYENCAVFLDRKFILYKKILEKYEK